MLELAAALIAQDGDWPEGLRAECILTGEVRGRRVHSISPVCPAEVPDPEGLQAYVEAMLARIEYPFSMPRLGSLNTTLQLEWSGEAWHLPEPARLLSIAPDYPRRALNPPLNAHCPAALTVAANGQPTAVEVNCLSFEEWGEWRDGRMFEPEAREALEGYLVLIAPDRDEACHETTLDFRLVEDDEEPANVPGGWVAPDSPRCPDASQASEPNLPAASLARCLLVAEGEDMARRGPQAIRAECPSGVDEAQALQAAAAVAVAAVDLDFDRERFEIYEVATSLEFVRDADGDWVPQPGQPVITREPMISPRAVERGATQMVCAAAIRPDEAGIPVEPDIACLSDARGVDGYLERAMREALENSRFLPVDYPYCLDNQYHKEAVVLFQGGFGRETTPPGPMPDPARLPNLCEAGQGE